MRKWEKTIQRTLLAEHALRGHPDEGKKEEKNPLFCFGMLASVPQQLTPLLLRGALNCLFLLV